MQSLSGSPRRPEIFEHLDYRSFMEKYYGFKKAVDPNFSYQAWSEKVGFKSRSFLRLIIAGRRSVTASVLPQLVHALDLRSHEAAYFSKLVDYNSATTFESRNYHFQQLLKLNKSKTMVKVRDAYRFLASYKNPRLLTLLGLEGGPKDPQKIAKSLGLSLAETESLLEGLQALGLVEKMDSDHWQATLKTFEVPEDLGNLAIQSFHKQSLAEASQALSLDPKIRIHGSRILTLTPQDYEQFQDELNQFLDQLVTKYHQSKIPAQPTGLRLYQINFNFIPVSETLIQENGPMPSCAPESEQSSGNREEEV